MDLLKKCEKCSNEYPATVGFFNPRYNGRNPSSDIVYLSRKCRECNRIYLNQYNASRRDIIRKNAKRSRTKHKLKNLCKRCNNKRLEHSQMCESHWFISIARNAGLRESIEDGLLIKKILEKQNYICPYSGEKLVPGLNCSLDHVKPRSRYPELEKDPSNLEWTTILVNRSKYNMTKEEYYDFIKTVHNHISGRYIVPITID